MKNLFCKNYLGKKVLALLVLVVMGGNVRGQTTLKHNDGYLSIFKVTSASTLTNTGTAILIEEYLPTGDNQSTPNFTVTVPSATGNKVVVSGSATSAGEISRSENGRFILIPGYNALIGDANTTFTTNGTVRTLNGSGTIGAGINAGGTLWLSANNNLRGATSDDGTNYWISGGSTGIQTTANGTTITTVSTTSTNTRGIAIFNGQLFYSTGSATNGIYSVYNSSPKPIIAGTTNATLAAPSTSPYGFSISPDGLTIYAFSSANNISRFTYSGSYTPESSTPYSGGTWSSASTGFVLTGALGVAVDWSGYSFSTGANGAIVYANNPTTLVKGLDNGTAGITTTTLRTITGNNAFRGLAFSPIKQTVSKGANTPAAGNLDLGLSNASLFQFNLRADEGNSTIKKLILNQSGTATIGSSNSISNFRLYSDPNGDGSIADGLLLSNGTVTGSNITFNAISLTTYIVEGTSNNFIVIGDISATGNGTFIPSILSDKTINSISYTSNLVNAGGSLVTMGTSTSAPIGNTLTIGNNWTGTTSTSWNNTSNWSMSRVPLSTDNITISSGSPVMDVDYTIASGRTLTISGTGSLTINPTKTLTIAGTADFGGKLVTLKSDATGSAAIGQITGTLSNATNITVERYIPANRKYRFLASPVVGATAANWRNNGTNTAGIGTHITGGTVGNNFDQSTLNAPSAFWYNEVNAGSLTDVGSGASNDPGWTAFADGNTEPLNNGKGFRIFVRGDRTLSLTGSIPAANVTTLSVTGTYPANSVSIATTKTNSNTNSGFNLVGNPYPSNIDWNTVTKGTGISATYSTFNPSANAYVQWNGTTGDATRYIASGQAFFVQQLTGTTSSITIAEANKVSNAAGNFFRNKLADHLKISMKYDSANYDAAFIHFREDAQNDFDTYDGLKFQNAGVNIASVGTDGKRYNINSLASLTETTEIPLSVLGSALTNFELKFDDVSSFQNHKVYMIDHYLNKMLLLSDGFTYPIVLSSDSASVKDGRFKIVFVQKATGIDPNIKNANAFILYPNPATDVIHLLLDAKNTNNENVAFEIYNQLGALMQQGKLDFTAAKDQTIAIDQLAQGSYFIKLHGQAQNQIIKFIK